MRWIICNKLNVILLTLILLYVMSKYTQGVLYIVLNNY